MLVGEIGVGKSKIMDLFPGETVLEVAEDLSKKIEKPLRISGLENYDNFTLREIDIVDLIENPKLYRQLLDSVDIICIVTNSAASNLGRTKTHFSRLKPLVKKTDFYIIANFQDSKESAFEPEKIEESFGIKTYGFSAIQEDSRENIHSIFIEIVKASIVDKAKTKIDEKGYGQFPKLDDLQEQSKDLSQVPEVIVEEEARDSLGVGHEVFISYSSHDKDVANAVCHFLEQHGIKCWIAPRDVLAGTYASSIVDAIENSKLMVLIFTNNANFSNHVKRELELAVSNKIMIQPIRTEDVKPISELKYYISSMHWLDALTPPLEEHLPKLAQMVSHLLEFI